MLPVSRKLLSSSALPPARAPTTAPPLEGDCVPFPTPEHCPASPSVERVRVHGLTFGFLDRVVAATLFGCLVLSTAGCSRPAASEDKKTNKDAAPDLVTPAPVPPVAPAPPKIDRRTEGNVKLVIEPSPVLGKVAARLRLTSEDLTQIASGQIDLDPTQRDLLLIGRAHRTAPGATLVAGDSVMSKKVLEDRDLLEAHLITRWARIHDWLLEKDNIKGAAPILRSWLALGAVHPQLAKRVERDGKLLLTKVPDPANVTRAIQAQPSSIAEPRTMPDQLRAMTGKGPKTPAAAPRPERMFIKEVDDLTKSPTIDLDRVAELNPRLSHEALLLHHLSRVHQATPKARRKELDTILDIGDAKQVGIVIDAYLKDAEKHFEVAKASPEMADELRAWLALAVEVPKLADRIGYSVGDLLDRTPDRRLEVIEAILLIPSPWWEAPIVQDSVEGLTRRRLAADIDAVGGDGQEYLRATAKENFGRVRAFVDVMRARDRLTPGERVNLQKIADMIPGGNPTFGPWSATILDGEHFINATKLALDANATLRREPGFAAEAPNRTATRAAPYLITVMRAQSMNSVNSYTLDDQKAQKTYRAALQTLPRESDGKISQLTRDLLQAHKGDLLAHVTPRGRQLINILDDFLKHSE